MKTHVLQISSGTKIPPILRTVYCVLKISCSGNHLYPWITSVLAIHSHTGNSQTMKLPKRKLVQPSWKFPWILQFQQSATEATKVSHCLTLQRSPVSYPKCQTVRGVPKEINTHCMLFVRKEISRSFSVCVEDESPNSFLTWKISGTCYWLHFKQTGILQPRDLDTTFNRSSAPGM